MRRCVSCGLVLAFVVSTRTARAEDASMRWWLTRGRDPIAVLARGLALVVLSGLAAKADVGVGRPPLSLVRVAWPTLEPQPATGGRPPSFYVPDGGRKTLLFATLVDLRF